MSQIIFSLNIKLIKAFTSLKYLYFNVNVVVIEYSKKTKTLSKYVAADCNDFLYII